VTTRDRVCGMLLGVGVGDALGMPVETFPHQRVKDTYGKVDQYLVPDGHKWFNGHKAGTCTDDTQLSLAVGEGLILSGGKPDMETQVQAHVNAFRESTSGWGPTTREALRRLSNGASWKVAGAKEGKITGLGNGCPMKIAPAALLLLQNIPDTTSFLADLCGMTHQTSVAVSSGLAHAFGLSYCLESGDTFNTDEFVDMVLWGSDQGRKYFPETLTEEDITERLRLCKQYADYAPEKCVADFQNGRCYVYCSLPFSYMFFLRNPKSIEALYEVVSAGGDADTNGSMVAALLGALNGTKVFPSHLVDGLQGKDALIDLANRLCDIFRIT